MPERSRLPPGKYEITSPCPLLHGGGLLRRSQLLFEVGEALQRFGFERLAVLVQTALLLAFVLMGRGLGASGAFSSVVTAAVGTAAPAHAAGNAFYVRYLGDGANPLKDWLIFEIIGVVIGGLASGFFAGRLRWTTEHGPRITDRRRLINAFVGGTAMGLGAKLARGCTSGLGLTGGATLSVGSWLFVIAAFVGAYAAAPLIRKAWQ